jgi:hypothetical protein
MAEITEQIVREAPEIEKIKLGLLQSAKALPTPTLPAYQIAGFTPEQLQAMQTGMAGIGSYLPYMQGAQTAATAGAGMLGRGADILQGADTRAQFTAAQQAAQQAGTPISQMGGLAFAAGQGAPLLGGAASDIEQAQQMAQQYSQAQLGPYQQMMAQSAAQARGTGPQFGGAQNVLSAGIGSLGGAAQGFRPSDVQSFMNPYQQQVIDESLRQINRQGDIARQNLQAQAVRSGAFGGSREGVQRAELERGLSESRNAAIVGGLSQGYQSAAQQAQQAFEQQQQRQLAQAQGYQGAAGQLGTMEAQRASQALAAEQYGGNIAQQLASQQFQQAGMGQQAAGLYGNLAQQQAALAGQYGNLAQQQAGILGQQAGLGQAQAGLYGNLAQQQFGIGSQLGQGLGSLGSQLTAAGMQQGQLGGMAQGLGQQDVNFQYGLGSMQQQQKQRELDALRATQLQSAYQPYQQLAFLSDIYKGAPSSQMALTTQAAPAPSPFQQIAGLATGALATAGAVKQAGGLF